MTNKSTVNKKGHSSTPLQQVWHFVIHLRWHYQLFILSGGFLLGGFLSSSMDWHWFLIQFANVHLLLFGGATAYNSYWDRDTGPVGGLKNPPGMTRWMWPASLMLQLLGLLVALPVGTLFVTFYGLSMLLFWLYSTPLFRWKGRPILSLIAIGISTGANSVILGYLAAAVVSAAVTITVIIPAVGTALILLSLYPVSQVYQLNEDTLRGDRTFAVQYGYHGVFLFFKISFMLGLLLIGGSILYLHTIPGVVFLVLGGVTGAGVWMVMRRLSSEDGDYEKVMWIKYSTSLAFVSFLLIALFIKHLD